MRNGFGARPIAVIFLCRACPSSTGEISCAIGVNNLFSSVYCRPENEKGLLELCRSTLGVLANGLLVMEIRTEVKREAEEQLTPRSFSAATASSPLKCLKGKDLMLGLCSKATLPPPPPTTYVFKPPAIDVRSKSDTNDEALLPSNGYGLPRMHPLPTLPRHMSTWRPPHRCTSSHKNLTSTIGIPGPLAQCLAGHQRLHLYQRHDRSKSHHSSPFLLLQGERDGMPLARTCTR